MEGMKIAHEEDGGILETEPSVKAITSGGPILVVRESKVDATAMGLAFAWFLVRGNHFVMWRGGDQGAGDEDSWPVVPGVERNSEMPIDFTLAHADRRQGEHLVGQVSVQRNRDLMGR